MTNIEKHIALMKQKEKLEKDLAKYRRLYRKANGVNNAYADKYGVKYKELSDDELTREVRKLRWLKWTIRFFGVVALLTIIVSSIVISVNDGWADILKGFQ